MIKTQTAFHLIFCIFALNVGCDLAGAAQTKCPAMKKGLPFTSLSLFDGNPDLGVDLAPDNADSPFPHVWTLHSISPWLVCNYGPKGKKLYTKKLNSHYSMCKTVESVKGSGVFDSVDCKTDSTSSN